MDKDDPELRPRDDSMNPGQPTHDRGAVSLGGEATFAGKKAARPQRADLSLGDQQTLGGGDAASLDTVIDDIEVVDLEARYKVEGTLGQGGMGAVLLATDTRLDRKVAIKRILGEAARSKNAIMRFLTEAKAIAALNHPNIVQIYDYGRAKDGPFLIMEYVNGGSVADRCKQGALPLDETVSLACQLCDGLAKAHDAGIVHRDIKPANVLLNQDGHPKLTDFGLAKAEAHDHGMTTAGAVMGTPDFMPPEQIRGAEEVDHRSDLWSLAATVYQMVTGRSPKIIRFDLLPAELTKVLGKALEEEKDARFQSAREFRDALKTSVRAAAVVVEELAEGTCPSCGVKNELSRRFCRGCGETLEAPCLSCTQPMPIWEEICGACGAKQTPLVDEQRHAMAARQAEAEGLLGDFEFARALEIAAHLRNEAHPKLKHLSGWASSFLEQIEKSRAEQTQQAIEAMAEARKHEAAHDYLSAASALETIPETMRSAALPGMQEPAAGMLERVIATQAEARRLETLIEDRIASKQFDTLLPEVEKLLALWPDREHVRKIYGQLIERSQRQETARDEAVATAKAALANHDYETACAALSGVAAAAVTPEVVSLRERAEVFAQQVRSLRRTIKDLLAAKQFDGLLETVGQYLRIKPEDPEIGRLQQSLIEREEKISAETAARMEQAGKLAQSCRFDEAAKLLNGISEPRRSPAVIEAVQRAYRLSALRKAAIESLAGAGSGTYNAAIKASLGYRDAIAEAQVTDQEFATLVAKAEAAHAEEVRWQRRKSLAITTAAAIVAGIAVILGGLWIRSSARDAALTEAIKQARWAEALTIDPLNPQSLVGRARSKLEANPADIEGAFADIEQASRQPAAGAIVQEARSEAHAARARSKLEANPADIEGAFADIAQASRHPAAGTIVQKARAEAHAARAAAEAKAGRLDRADGDFQAAILFGANQAALEAAKAAIAEAWLARAEQAAVNGDGAGIKTALENAGAAGADRGAVLGRWRKYANGCVAKLDSKGLEFACQESKKAGFEGAEQAEWWIRFGRTAAEPLYESAELVIHAVDKAAAAGASMVAVAPLRAKGKLLAAVAAQKNGDQKTAVSELYEAARFDPKLVQTTLTSPIYAALRTAFVADHRRRFDDAVGKQDWHQAVKIATTANAVEESAADWVNAAVASLTPAAAAALPPAALAAMPPAAILRFSPEAMLKLPPLRNSVGIKLRLIPAGKFTMGQAASDSDETPHQVTLTKPFYLGVHEVTNAQWKRVMANVPSKWKEDDRPVEQVSWEDAIEFCKKLSALPEERQAGRVYRLPTEAEWEYACRAGTTTPYSFGDDASRLGDYAWYDDNSSSGSHPVGKKKPNPWGLHDMHGNVREWCSDWTSRASLRVFRGGSWLNASRDCRSASRGRHDPSYPYSFQGFRLALSPSESTSPEADNREERRPGGSTAEPATDRAEAERLERLDL